MLLVKVANMRFLFKSLGKLKLHLDEKSLVISLYSSQVFCPKWQVMSRKCCHLPLWGFILQIHGEKVMYKQHKPFSGAQWEKYRYRHTDRSAHLWLQPAKFRRLPLPDISNKFLMLALDLDKMQVDNRNLGDTHCQRILLDFMKQRETDRHTMTANVSFLDEKNK